MSRSQRISAYLASQSDKTFKEWLAQHDHPDRLAGKVWPLGAIALFVLACFAVAMSFIVLAVKTRPGVH